MKKTILHIIDNLGRGGAETMLVTVVKQLPEYNNIIVTLSRVNDFGKDLECDRLYCLEMHSPLQVPLAAVKLRRIIKQNNVSIVHSHLFWSTVVARMGVPKHCPLITTIHTSVATSIDYAPWRMKVIEQFTYRLRKSTIVAVAKAPLKEYFSFIRVKPHYACHLYTFVDTAVFNENIHADKNTNDTFRLVAVGNLKEEKNHRFLLEAFKELKHENISLDIYGKGILQEELQQTIDDHQLKVTLKGQVKNIQDHIKQYHLFVMPSSSEGFALSVLEAMALGMPMLLTDIISFKEQCDDTAHYFKLNDITNFVAGLTSLKNNPEQLKALGIACKKRVLENYTLQQHMCRLKKIYNDSLGQSLISPGL